ncbi:hypothetical protein ACFWAR_23045 [Streptomyces sp. NPDC059917]|uniref:hypothetical protein n=1 Tax=Streptomyces sp. NPDC059917 TaxID=3347002 RepID=UPI003664EDC6
MPGLRRLRPARPAPRPPGAASTRTEALVQQLESESGASYDARAELIWLGSAAVPAIIDGLPSLGASDN